MIKKKEVLNVKELSKLKRIWKVSFLTSSHKYDYFLYTPILSSLERRAGRSTTNVFQFWLQA